MERKYQTNKNGVHRNKNTYWAGKPENPRELLCHNHNGRTEDKRVDKRARKNAVNKTKSQYTGGARKQEERMISGMVQKVVVGAIFPKVYALRIKSFFSSLYARKRRIQFRPPYPLAYPKSKVMEPTRKVITPHKAIRSSTESMSPRIAPVRMAHTASAPTDICLDPRANE